MTVRSTETYLDTREDQSALPDDPSEDYVREGLGATQEHVQQSTAGDIRPEPAADAAPPETQEVWRGYNVKEVDVWLGALKSRGRDRPGVDQDAATPNIMPVRPGVRSPSGRRRLGAALLRR
jgi:hypothetical protein